MQAQEYLLLDAARVGQQLVRAKELNQECMSLYREKSEAYLATVAPYLFTVEHGTPFVEWYYRQGWGDSWGMLVSAAVSVEDLYKHLRRLLTVRTEDRRELYFRFYDPRVLRVFLPTCDKEQIAELFGPIEYFTLESEDKQEAIQYWHQNGSLQQRRILADQIFGKEHVSIV